MEVTFKHSKTNALDMTKLEYERAIAWIVRNRGGGNGYPARNNDVVRIAGWKLVQLVADLFDKSPREVANDVIAFDHFHEHGEGVSQ